MPRFAAYESPFQVTLKGVAAGLVGTLVMTSALQVIGRLFLRRPSEPPEEEATTAELTSLDASPPLPPTEQVAERLANQVFGTELSHETRQRLGVGIHWAYGAALGALSAQPPVLRPPALPYGIALGLAVWAVGPARLVSALGLYERPAASSVIRRAVSVSLHVLYGVVTALTLERLSTSR